MIPAITASKIYSILGNNNSLVPLAIKDVANSIGLTTGSYIIGKKEEGQDRFIDEFGTQALWLFGIPTYKKILDFTLFKGMGYDHKIDVRLLKNKDILEKAKEFAHNQEVKSAFEKIGKNQKTFKGLTFAKFAVSTLLTIGTYGAMTHYRHKYTENSIRKKLLAQINANFGTKNEEVNNNSNPNEPLTPNALPLTKPAAFTAVSANPQNKKNNQNSSQLSFQGLSHNSNNQNSSQLSFQGLSHNSNNQNSSQLSFQGGVSDFMFSPVKNLMLLDGAITGERLLTSRSLQDFLGYSVKEGSFWIFMYFAGQKIQNHLEKVSETKHNKSIDLDARVIESDELKKAFHDNSLKKSINEFANCKTDVEIYEFINKNPDNFVVKMAKKSDVVKTVASNENLFVKLARKIGLAKKLENADVVDTRAYIDIDEFKGVANKLDKLHNQYEKSGESLDTFLNGVKKLKRASVWKNMGSCILALGVLAPAIMIGIRYLRQDKEFQVKEQIEKELANNGKIQ